jgi:peroxiredoxin
MMKSLFYALACLMVGFVLMQCTPKEKSNTTASESSAETAPEVNDLPALNIRQTDGQVVALREVSGKIVLIFFNPGCDHCEREAEQIKNRKQPFNNHTVYFISTESAESSVAFSKKYDLTDKNFVFAQADAAAVFESVGNLPSVPAIFIYDNKKLIKRFDGETSLDVIQQYL